jgi:hypothetical protein
MNHARTAIAVSTLALSAGALGATEASAQLAPEPGSGYTATPDCHWSYHPVCDEVPVPVPPVNGTLPTAVVTYGWPDEGTGYPGFADQPSPTSTEPNQGLDPTSVALGALAGIALGGAGLGVALVVKRRRDHVTLLTP